MKLARYVRGEPGSLVQWFAELIRGRLRTPGMVLRLVSNARTADVRRFQDYLDAVSEVHELVALTDRIDLAPGTIRIALDVMTLSQTIGIAAPRIDPEALVICAPFRIRKRGVDTKIILNGAARPVDQALLTNIARAHACAGMIKDGRTYAQIAENTGTSKCRIQRMLDLAFLAPYLVRAVMQGTQPLGFTSDWCLRHQLSSDWDEQRRLLAHL